MSTRLWTRDWPAVLVGGWGWGGVGSGVRPGGGGGGGVVSGGIVGRERKGCCGPYTRLTPIQSSRQVPEYWRQLATGRMGPRVLDTKRYKQHPSRLAIEPALAGRADRYSHHKPPLTIHALHL